MKADCDAVREIAPELALGIAAGDERAWALDHLARCGDCQREVSALAGVSDALLLLAPEAEPPAGFENRVLAAMTPPPPRARRARAWLRPVVALAVGAALASSVAVLAYRDDHRLANDYRQALAAADGHRFTAIPLRDGAGRKRGSVSLYEGSPSWLVVTVPRGYERRIVSARLVTRTGARQALPAFALRGRVWGGALPVAVDQVASVQLFDRDGKSALVGYTAAHW